MSYHWNLKYLFLRQKKIILFSDHYPRVRRFVSGQSQVSLRSVSGQSQVSLRSVPGQSQVSLRSVLGLSVPTSSLIRQTEPKIIRLFKENILLKTTHNRIKKQSPRSCGPCRVAEANEDVTLIITPPLNFKHESPSRCCQMHWW